MARLRGQRYRQDLAYLSDERWFYAVSVARRRRWFPAIEELEQFATEMPEGVGAPMLPEHKVSREEFRRGYEEFRRELEARGINLGSIGNANHPSSGGSAATGETEQQGGPKEA